MENMRDACSVELASVSQAIFLALGLGIGHLMKIVLRLQLLLRK